MFRSLSKWRKKLPSSTRRGKPVKIEPCRLTVETLETRALMSVGTVSEWASSVVGFSSQYSSSDWSAAQALGAPDTISYGDHSTAWAPFPENGSQEYLQLAFAVPVYATSITIAETDGNGFVTRVDVQDTSNQMHTLFSGTDTSQPGAPANFAIPLAQTSYLVQSVKIYVDTNHNLNTWEEIDAVQLQGVASSSGILPATTEWASSVLGESSEFSLSGWSAAQALGAPNSTSYGDHSTAWAPFPENGTQEYLELGYAQPVYATGANIVEADGNGFVTRVDLIDTNNQVHTVFSGTDPTQPGSVGNFTLSLAQTPYLVKGVKVYVNTNHNPSTWEEIDAVQLQGVAGGSTTAAPPAGTLTPAQIQSAYGFNQVGFLQGDYNQAGAGQTIAIVDGYWDPNIQADANSFSQYFHLPQFNSAGGPALSIAMPYGTPSLPPAATPQQGSWGEEISLDVEWAHAIAPSANVLLVEVPTADVYLAAQWAAAQPGVTTVSMSFGGAGSSSDLATDADFTTPAGHAGVTFVAAAGDTGKPDYPATSPNVLAVGGTTLSVNASTGAVKETYWSDSTGSGGTGTDPNEPEPAYQKGFQSTGNRNVPDVSYDAGGAVAVFDSFDQPSSPWMGEEGTSAGTPQWASLIAIADQSRALAGLASLNGATQALPALYSLPSSDYSKIASGHTPASGNSAYDMATGLGTPHASQIIAGLTSFTTATSVSPSALKSTTSSSSVAAALVAPLDVAMNGWRQFEIGLAVPRSAAAKTGAGVVFVHGGREVPAPWPALVPEADAPSDLLERSWPKH